MRLALKNKHQNSVEMICLCVNLFFFKTSLSRETFGCINSLQLPNIIGQTYRSQIGMIEKLLH